MRKQADNEIKRRGPHALGVFIQKNVAGIFCAVILLLFAYFNLAAAATTVTQGATSNQAVATGWTNASNAYGATGDNSYATAVVKRSDPSISSDYGSYGFDGVIPVGATIDQVELLVEWMFTDCSGNPGTLDVGAVVSGSLVSTEHLTCQTTETTNTVDMGDGTSWTRDDLLDANFKVRVIANSHTSGNPNQNQTFSLDRIAVRVTYTPPPVEYTQSAYRVFENTDSTDAGSALASQNTPATLSPGETQFRVRTLVHISNAALAESGQDLKLQFARKGVGTCASPQYSYGDVGTSTDIAFLDNATPTDGAALTTNANDPTHSSDTVNAQEYVESNTFSNSQSSLAVGADGMWDFSLVSSGSAPPDTTYCLRIIQSDGTALDTYDVYPEITTASSALTCSASASSTDFGSLNTSTVATSNPNITITMSCLSSSGCSLSIRDQGDGTTSGLSATGGVTHLIASSTTTLVAGTEGYGVQGSLTGVGSGGALTIDAAYDKTGNNVGALSLSEQTLASSSGSLSGREVVVAH